MLRGTVVVFQELDETECVDEVMTFANDVKGHCLRATALQPAAPSSDSASEVLKVQVKSD